MLLLESSGAHIIVPWRKCDASVNVPKAKKAKIHPAGSHLTILLLAGFNLYWKIEMHGVLNARLAGFWPIAVFLWGMTLFISSQHKWIALVVDQLSVDFLNLNSWHDAFNKSAIVFVRPHCLGKVLFLYNSFRSYGWWPCIVVNSDNMTHEFFVTSPYGGKLFSPLSYDGYSLVPDYVLTDCILKTVEHYL